MVRIYGDGKIHIDDRKCSAQIITLAIKVTQTTYISPIRVI